MTTRFSATLTLLLAALAVVLAGCDRLPENTAEGYVEGDFVFIAAERAGRIAELPLAEGTHAEAGTLLFRLDTSVEEAALAAAEACARRFMRPFRVLCRKSSVGRAK